MDSIWFVVVFTLVVLGLLALDLGVFHRKAHAVSLKEAALWTAIWVTLSMLFCLGIYLFHDHQKALEFLAGYLVEEALSVDNLFVFIVIFEYFNVPAKYKHRVLFWGILGALIMRGTLIGFGALLVSKFHWIIYIFGAILVYTGFKLLTQSDEDAVEPEKNPLLKIVRRRMPVTEGYRDMHFFVKESGRWMATPLLIVLVVIESTDLIFALDSIPAIFGITTNPFVVYSSNVCAILGLRSLYFLLASIMDKFRYLKVGISAVLIFVGLKMLAEIVKIHLPIGISLAVVASLLVGSVVASMVLPSAGPEKPAEEPAPPADGDPAITESR
jgi:tellurite resistance protein TerC